MSETSAVTHALCEEIEELKAQLDCTHHAAETLKAELEETRQELSDARNGWENATGLARGYSSVISANNAELERARALLHRTLGCIRDMGWDELEHDILCYLGGGTLASPAAETVVEYRCGDCGELCQPGLYKLYVTCRCGTSTPVSVAAQPAPVAQPEQQPACSYCGARGCHDAGFPHPRTAGAQPEKEDVWVAMPAKAEPVGWQPIETAPKRGHVRVAWNPDDWTTGDAYRREGKWFAAAFFVFGYKEIEVKPLYWQPIPPAPKEPKA